MPDLYPRCEPYAHGLLDVGDGNHVYWEACGNPQGKPAVAVHGGPGGGWGTWMRRYFDPARYRAIFFDQRGCGRSTPSAGLPSTKLGCNTTEHLLADMERLREHLGIARWLVYGTSWGATLALAYAERHPHRVCELVLTSIMTSRRTEIDWLYRGVRCLFPGEWLRFRDGVPESHRDGDLIAAYSRLMNSTDAQVREQAALEWLTWEDTVVSLEPGGDRRVFRGRPAAAQQAFVRICAHYWLHGAWLDEGAILRDAGRLSGIPGVLIHGRHDLSCPLATAWELSRHWAGAELRCYEDGGHLGSDTSSAWVLEALAAFATR